MGNPMRKGVIRSAGREGVIIWVQRRKRAKPPCKTLFCGHKVANAILIKVVLITHRRPSTVSGLLMVPHRRQGESLGHHLRVPLVTVFCIHIPAVFNPSGLLLVSGSIFSEALLPHKREAEDMLGFLWPLPCSSNKIRGHHWRYSIPF